MVLAHWQILNFFQPIVSIFLKIYENFECLSDSVWRFFQFGHEVRRKNLRAYKWICQAVSYCTENSLKYVWLWHESVWFSPSVCQLSFPFLSLSYAKYTYTFPTNFLNRNMLRWNVYLSLSLLMRSSENAFAAFGRNANFWNGCENKTETKMKSKLNGKKTETKTVSASINRRYLCW